MEKQLKLKAKTTELPTSGIENEYCKGDINNNKSVEKILQKKLQQQGKTFGYRNFFQWAEDLKIFCFILPESQKRVDA